ncbi:MAG TPA: hypothetical protein VN203_23170, partial [Candidatus Acidoferrum sp.]|nr:hypothetical protein [Candidatus Acidoferrum sp.]
MSRTCLIDRRSWLCGSALMLLGGPVEGAGRRRILLGAGSKSILPPSMAANPPGIYVNLKSNQAQLASGRQVPATSVVTVSRASPATQVDSAGNWNQFASGVLARSDLGASIWEARTNGIRNNTMAGAVVMA